MKEEILREIELGKGVAARLKESFLTVKGPKGEIARNFSCPKLKISIEGEKVILKAHKGTKREKTMIGSFEAHIQNMVKGVREPHEYRLKICSGHFPMNVSLSGKELSIKNFFGESVPRKAALLPGAEVKVSGTEITVSSPDKEVAGQMAARIERLCRITNRDIRIFQDGCYITHKSGKVLKE